jgi:hypothetical protein
VTESGNNFADLRHTLLMCFEVTADCRGYVVRACSGGTETSIVALSGQTLVGPRPNSYPALRTMEVQEHYGSVPVHWVWALPVNDCGCSELAGVKLFLGTRRCACMHANLALGSALQNANTSPLCRVAVHLRMNREDSLKSLASLSNSFFRSTLITPLRHWVRHWHES